MPSRWSRFAPPDALAGSSLGVDMSRPPAQETWFDAEAPAPREAPGSPSATERLVGRYLLLEPIGRGAASTVWLAWDELDRAEVAIKRVAAGSPRDLALARREAVALRQARLPGVVQLRDEFPLGGDWYLVMERAKGVPFPGPLDEEPWTALAPRLRRLLEILATLHDAGLLHGDLKPSNVFVDPASGAVTVLDLGLARGRSLTSPPGRRHFAGTPAYAAPELLGGGGDHRLDLYAVGLMVYEALTGEIPAAHPDPIQMLASRARQRFPLPAAVAARLPDTAVALVEALIAPLPEDRPDNAWQALRALGQASLDERLDGLGIPTTAADIADLRRLFHGPEVFLHLPEDAARVLHARTGGAPPAIREELTSWIRAGICRTERERLWIDRPSIARLEAREALVARPLGEPRDRLDALERLIGMAWPFATEAGLREALGEPVGAAIQELHAAGRCWPVAGGWAARPLRALGLPEAPLLLRMARAHREDDPARVELLFRGGASLEELVAACLAVLDGDRLSPEAALAMLAPHLARARAEQAAASHRKLLVRFVETSLALDAPGPLERALFEVQRAIAERASTDDLEPPLEALEALLRAALAWFRGDREALESQLARLGPLDHEELDAWRCGLEVERARRTGEDAWQARLEDLRTWAGGRPARQARLDGWVANRLYAQGRFAEAAALHEAAASRRATQVGRLAAQRAAASAWMEAGEPGLAMILAGQVATIAARHRHARLELLATWCARSAAARSGMELQPWEEGVEAGFQVDPLGGAMLALGEACLAWRRGDRGLAGRLARRAQPEFAARGARAGETLATLLLALADPPGSPASQQARARLDEALPPGLRVQMMHLLATHLADPDLAAQARQAALELRRQGGAQRLELLDLDDILGPESSLPPDPDRP